MKKGATHLDWVISFTLFLVYVVWFFSFLNPFLTIEDSAQPYQRIVVEEFDTNVSWMVEKTPLYVYSNISSSNEPVIVRFEKDWPVNTFQLVNNNQTVWWDEQLFFITDLSNSTNVFNLVYSNESYNVSEPVEDFDVMETTTRVSTESFTAEFDSDYLLNTVHHHTTKINNISYLANNAELNISSSIFNSSSKVAQYKVVTQAFNISQYTFSYNSRMYGYVVPNAGIGDTNLTLNIEFVNYSHYHADNSFTGPLPHDDVPVCYAGNGDYLSFFNSAHGVSIVLSNVSSLQVCDSNTTVEVSVNVPLHNSSFYKFIFHNGNYTEKSQYVEPYETAVGEAVWYTGYKESLVKNFTSYTYSDLKNTWKYPLQREFSILVKNESSQWLDYLRVDNATTNVFAHTEQRYAIDKYGNVQRVETVVRTW